MNVGMLLDMAVEGFGDRVVIGRTQDGLTAAELQRRALAGARLVQESGADAIVYLAVNGPAFPVALFAAAAAGVPLVPVNYRLGAAQLDAVLGNHPKAYGIADEEQQAALAAAGIGSTTPAEWLATTAVAESLAEGFADPDSPAVIIYTSGTTSAPKGVLLRHANLTSYVLGSVEFMGAEADDAALVSVPPYHVAAVANVLSNLYAGRRTIVLEQFAPEQWLDVVREEGVTNALVVPTMLKRIVDCDAAKDVPTLRTLAYGGAPMPGVVIERALELWPGLDFVNAYGLTETSSTIAVLGPEDHRAALASSDPAVRARLGSTGQPLPSVTIEIRDADGAVCPPGVPGRIWVAGDQVSAEYAGKGRAVDDRGFFDTRDEGHLDDGGFLFIGGRTDDTIIRGAENIAPAEIEEVLLRHPAVSDVVVVGVPHEEWGHAIEAAVVARDGAEVDPEALRAHVRSALRSSKTPDTVHVWPELPRTETGKLVRRLAVERILAERTPLTR
jgi:acyl-CoA synthetase (AMP-forming)/AMP-acid ligase II